LPRRADASQQSSLGQHSIFLGDVMANQQACALFPSNRNLVLYDEFANVLKSNWSLVQLNAMFLGQRVDQIRGGDPAAPKCYSASIRSQLMAERASG
jgi:hypothetical protein